MTREEFKLQLCNECGCKYEEHLGEAEYIIAITIDDDVNIKAKIKAFMNKHHWQFVECREIYGTFGTKREYMGKEITYASSKGHKCIICVNA